MQETQLKKQSEIAVKLKIDLKLKRHIRSHELNLYAEQLNVIFKTSSGKNTYYWSDEQYQQLKSIFEP